MLIYLDASVVVAEILAEDRRPTPSLWDEGLVSSRLLEYETWTRINALGLGLSRGELVGELFAVISLIELSPLALARALEPFPLHVRTLDALHLSSMWYMRQQGDRLSLATYDDRLARAAEALGFPLYDLN